MYILDVLNLLEEFAILINKNKDMLDEEILCDNYQTILREYFLLLKPWIEDRRSSGNKPRIYRDLEELFNKWQDR